MSIQRRLFWSNILMIVIPVTLSALISYIILFVFTQNSPVPIEQAFPMAFDAVNNFQRSGDMDALMERIDYFNESLESSDVMMAIMDGDDYLYPAYAAARVSESGGLLQALIRDGATGSVYINNSRFAIEQVGQYRIILTERHANTRGFRPHMRGIPWIFLIVLGAILLTNRLLTHVLSRSITVPLRQLADGARSLGEGNLSTRIAYRGKDEFLSVCLAFNEMAEQLQQLIAYQQKNEQSRKELLAGISHDLRTPLTSIKAYVEGLLDGVAEDLSTQLKYLGIIRNKAEDIDRIVDKLFLFAKLDIGEYPANPEQLDIGDELRAMEAAVEEEYNEKGLTMQVDSRLSGVFIHMDPVYLHNILVNLLENSLRYKQKERCHVTVDCSANDLSVTVSLTDDGPGVREDELEKIFDVFYRGDPSRQDPSKGSGLGLAISARMMNRVGGSIRAENAAGGGLRIVLQFPRCGEQITGGEPRSEKENPDHRG